MGKNKEIQFVDLIQKAVYKVPHKTLFQVDVILWHFFLVSYFFLVFWCLRLTPVCCFIFSTSTPVSITFTSPASSCCVAMHVYPFVCICATCGRLLPKLLSVILLVLCGKFFSAAHFVSGSAFVLSTPFTGSTTLATSGLARTVTDPIKVLCVWSHFNSVTCPLDSITLWTALSHVDGDVNTMAAWRYQMLPESSGDRSWLCFSD